MSDWEREVKRGEKAGEPLHTAHAGCALTLTCTPTSLLLSRRAEYARNKEVAIGMLLKTVLNIENPYA